MSTGLRVFLISPDQYIIYSLKDGSTGEEYIFNAGTLELIQNIQITEFREIKGIAIPTFGVKPVILGYKNGQHELVYASTGQVLTSDGKPAVHNGCSVTAKSIILIPDLDQWAGETKLYPVKLADPDESALQKYIDRSQKGPETEIKSDPLTVTNSGIRSPSPRISKPKDSMKASQLEELHNLRQEVNELRSIVKALNQRIYQIYPVELPHELRINGVTGPVISVDEIQKKITANDIMEIIVDPLFQPYAGSHRSNNRLITFRSKDGKLYHVRAAYDPKTNKIDHPK